MQDIKEISPSKQRELEALQIAQDLRWSENNGTADFFEWLANEKEGTQNDVS